jgi:hypothetical protein
LNTSAETTPVESEGNPFIAEPVSRTHLITIDFEGETVKLRVKIDGIPNPADPGDQVYLRPYLDVMKETYGSANVVIESDTTYIYSNASEVEKAQNLWTVVDGIVRRNLGLP